MHLLLNLQRASLALPLGAVLLCCAGVGGNVAKAAPPPVSAAAAASPAQQSFDRFCRSWMAKLSKRHEQNAKQVAYRKRNGQVVGEYIGYSREPLQCSVSETGVPANPFVGKLIYYEVRFRKSGKTQKAARGSLPQAFEEGAVMEFFRFDGTRWVY